MTFDQHCPLRIRITRWSVWNFHLQELTTLGDSIQYIHKCVVASMLRRRHSRILCFCFWKTVLLFSVTMRSLCKHFPRYRMCNISEGIKRLGWLTVDGIFVFFICVYASVFLQYASLYFNIIPPWMLTFFQTPFASLFSGPFPFVDVLIHILLFICRKWIRWKAKKNYIIHFWNWNNNYVFQESALCFLPVNIF